MDQRVHCRTVISARTRFRPSAPNALRPDGHSDSVNAMGEREREEPVAEAFLPGEATEAELDAVHELLRLCRHEAAPLMPYRSVAETAGYLRFPPAHESRVCWTVNTGRTGTGPGAGAPHGFALLRRQHGAGLTRVQLCVHPAHRRRSAGTALLDAVRVYAIAHGVETLVGRFAVDAGAAFCAAAGARQGRRDVRSVLLLDAGVEEGGVADGGVAGGGLETGVPTVVAVPGYRLIRWVGACPPGLLDSYATARAAVNDAPHDGADESWSVDRVRELEAAEARRGRAVRVSAVLDGRDTVVAFTETRVSAAPSPTATIVDTAVLREHRGRGLATWVKAAALAALRAERPDVSCVTTSNAEENRPIRAINERLGFVPAGIWTAAVLRAAGR